MGESVVHRHYVEKHVQKVHRAPYCDNTKVIMTKKGYQIYDMLVRNIIVMMV